MKLQIGQLVLAKECVIGDHLAADAQTHTGIEKKPPVCAGGFKGVGA